MILRERPSTPAPHAPDSGGKHETPHIAQRKLLSLVHRPTRSVMSGTGGTPPGPATTDLPHDSLQPNIIAASVACWTIAAIFVALRVYTRKWIINVFSASDWCILASLVRLSEPP